LSRSAGRSWAEGVDAGGGVDMRVSAGERQPSVIVAAF
jgi:hypothetical protein